MTGGHVLRFKHLQALETNVIDFLKESRASKGPELPVDLTVVVDVTRIIFDCIFFTIRIPHSFAIAKPC